jgi:flagellar biosynthesis protein FlhA
VRTERLLEGIADAITTAEQQAYRPVILCSGQLRPAIRRLVAPGHSHIPVLSYNEMTRTMSVEPVGVIRLVAAPATV